CSFAHRLLRKASVAGLTVLAVATRPTEQGGEVSFCTLSHKAAPVWKVCGAQSRSDCLRRQSVAPDEALARERRDVCTGTAAGANLTLLNEGFLRGLGFRLENSRPLVAQRPPRPKVAGDRTRSTHRRAVETIS